VYPKNDDTIVSTYLTNVAVVNESTAQKYNERLKKFGKYTNERYGLQIQNIVTEIRRAEIDPYDLLTGYILFLKQESNNTVAPNSLKNHVITIKNFLEYSDIEISPRKFKLKVRLPKIVRKNKEALSKEDIVDILNACSECDLTNSLASSCVYTQQTRINS
jgi:site-specific recombinase XerD